ncbi:MAG: adenosine kinase [Candidatus Pacearchaeota archaeon]
MIDYDYDVSGIGSALLDITYEIPDYILNDLDLKKGCMNLIDKQKSDFILNKLKKLKILKAKFSLGGSVSNTISGISYLGGKGIFFAKLGNDFYSEIYEKRTKNYGVTGIFSKHLIEKTGHCFILITSDKERTFATHLGASLFLNEKDLNFNLIKKSKILHIEAFLFDIPETKNFLLKLAEFVKNSKVKISLDLSDANLIKRNLNIIKNFVKDYVDIVFANENEAFAFTQHSDSEEALIEISKITKIAIVKKGDAGSIIKSNDTNYIIKIPAYKINIVNTNGAGDNYAAGFLYGLTNNFSLEKSGHFASFIASLVVGNESARLEEKNIEKINKFYFCKIL